MSPGPRDRELLSCGPQALGPIPEGKAGKAGPVLPLAAQGRAAVWEAQELLGQVGVGEAPGPSCPALDPGRRWL